MSSIKRLAENPLKIVWSIALIGGAIGLFLSWLVLSGDYQGKINLFYLLLVYLFIPLFSIIATFVTMVFSKGLNLARSISTLPIWSLNTLNIVHKVHQLNLDKYWYLMQSQMAAIAFSLASLAVFFTLLLATDLNFIWRSTILEAADVIHLLEYIAAPWSFWPAAQPDLYLLEMTQDSRVATSNSGFTEYGNWWRFIVAVQLFYSLLPRVLLLLVSRFWLQRKINKDIEQTLKQTINKHSLEEDESQETSPIIHHIQGTVLINNWDNIPGEIIHLIPSIDTSNDNYLSVDNKHDELSIDEQLIIVKAWEPPMGELEDYLKEAKGYLLPLDWDESGLCKLKNNHFYEWQRLINKYPSWQLFIPKEFIPNV